MSYFSFREKAYFKFETSVFSIDYYFSNGKLLFSRVISGSQEHILKLILMNIYSPDIISVYEFIMRLCKQSKAVIDNVLSFMVRDFEKRKSFYLRYLLGTILLFSILFYITTKLGDQIIYEMFVLPISKNISGTSIAYLFFGYMSLLSTTVLLHYAAAKSEFNIILNIAYVRFCLNLLLISLLVQFDLVFETFVQFNAVMLLIIGGFAYWKLTNIFKI